MPGTLLNVYYDFDGDGTTDQTATTLSSISHSYGTAGQYFPIVTIQTTSGRFSSVGGWNASGALRVNVQQTPSQSTFATITDPVDLKVGPSEHLFVLSRGLRTIKEYYSSGTEVRSLTSIGTSSSTPTGLDVDSAGNIYAALSGDHQVAKYKLDSGAYILDTAFNGSGLIGKSDHTSGTGNSQFNTPYDVAVTPDGTQIAVSDSGNHRVQNFKTSNGDFVSAFGTSGTGVGQFNTPKGLTYDGSGYLYIVDSGNNRIALALSSSVVGTSGTSGSALGHFSGAVNLGVGSRGVYIAETGNNRMQIFEPLRTGHGSVPTPFDVRLGFSTGLNQPSAIAPIADFLAEKIYMADTANNRVLKISFPETSTPVASWTSMMTSLSTGNIDQALTQFSERSAEDYRVSFLKIGSSGVTSVVSDIGSVTLTPEVIEGNSAEYSFERVLGGQTVTFPVGFVKENGVWKILEF